MSLVADIVTNSKYEQTAVARERGTIQAEVLSVHNDRWNTIAETSHFVSFRNNVLGLPILGMVDNLDKITSETVKRYHRNNYHGGNVKVVAVGGVDHSEIHQICEEAFKNLRQTPADRVGYSPPPAVFTPGYMWINQPELEDRVYSIINFEAPGYKNPDYIGFLLLNNLLGESDSSAGFLASLPRKTGFQAVGDSINLLNNYSKYKCCFLPYTDTGLFTLYLDCHIADAYHAENLLVAFVNDLLFSVGLLDLQLTEEKIEKAFNKSVNMILEQDCSMEAAQEIGAQLTYMGKRYPTKIWIDLIAGFANKEVLTYIIKKYLFKKVADSQPELLVRSLGRHPTRPQHAQEQTCARPRLPVHPV